MHKEKSLETQSKTNSSGISHLENIFFNIPNTKGTPLVAWSFFVFETLKNIDFQEANFH